MLNRRDFFRGVSLGAGAAAFGPFLSQLEAAANSPGKLKPMRFVFLVQGNGIDPNHVQPTSLPRSKYGNIADKLIDLPLAKETLPTSLEPLAPYVQRMTVIQGLSNRAAGAGNHSYNYGALGCYNKDKGPVDETIDAALAKAVPGIFPHVGLGITDKPDSNIVYNISAWERGRPLPTQCRPDLVHTTLFGSAADGQARKAFDLRTNTLDFMREDVKRVRARLDGGEREKFDTYLDAFESMRVRQDRLAEPAVQAALRKHSPPLNDKYTAKSDTDKLMAQFDIGAAALIGGLTNVLTLSSGAGDPFFGIVFDELGITLDLHGIGHGGGVPGLSSNECMLKVRRFHTELLAELVKKLDGVPEGDGTMLDNTLIVYTSDFGESHHPLAYEWPFVLIGNLGGRLKAGGRFLNYPKYGTTGHRTVSNLYTSMLHAAGKPKDSFGHGDLELKGLDQSGPLAELMV